MSQNNQTTNENQDQQRIVEAQVSESRNSENQSVDAEVSEGGSETSATIASSNLSAEKEAGELSAHTKNIQSFQKEGDLPARRGATGPRTAIGKKRSSRNAVKFGIFSRATLLPGESRSEYRSLKEGLWKTLQPEGELEELLVEKLVSIMWRYRRLLVAEGAEIRKKSEFLEIDRRRAQQQAAEKIIRLQQPETTIEFSLEPVGLIWEIQNPEILARCIEMLVELRRGIEADGLDEEQDGSLLEAIYGDPDRPHLRQTLHGKYSAWLDTAKMTGKERESEGCATPEQCKQSVLQEIGAEIARLKQYQEKGELIESERTKVEILRQRIPDSKGMDCFLRYDASLERVFDRTLTQLERIQRMRKGQPVFPPVKVDATL
jgi:hypothetical protein